MISSGPREIAPEILRFIDAHIDGIPELEALLLLHETAPATWDPVTLAKRLYIYQEETEFILAKLRRLGLATGDEARGFQFSSGSPDADLVAKLAVAYRKQLSAITLAVHNKPSRAVREFARAFDMKKDRNK